MTDAESIDPDDLTRMIADAERRGYDRAVARALSLHPSGKREWHNQGRSGECAVVDVSALRQVLLGGAA